MSGTPLETGLMSRAQDVEDIMKGTKSLAITTSDGDFESKRKLTTTSHGLESLLNELNLPIPIPNFSSVDILNTPLDIGRSYLAQILSNLAECDRSIAFDSIQLPTDIEFKDLTVRIPKLSPNKDFKTLGRNITQNFPASSIFNVPFVDGVHLHIIFAHPTFSRLLLPYITDRKETYGQHLSLEFPENPSSPSDRKKVVIEFSSPNLAKDFQPKHLRSTILGASIANLYLNSGWDVVKLNYLGDWGKDIALLGVGWEKFGSEEKFQAVPVGHLHDVYNHIYEQFLPEENARKKARDESIKHHELQDTADIESQGLFAERNAYFKRMEEGDVTATAFARRVRDANVESYKELYARLNVTFDEYSGESQVTPEAMAVVEDTLKSKGVLEESDGAWIIDLKKHAEKSGTPIIRDRTGCSTYLLRGLAAVFDRDKKYSFDKMIYVTTVDNNHFSHLSKILELMGRADLANKLEPVGFSKKTKSLDELGNTLDEILAKCVNAMQESLDSLGTNSKKSTASKSAPKSAASIAANALIAQELSMKRQNDLPFAFNRMTSFDSGTGPNLQWHYKKLRSILKRHPAPSSVSEEDVKTLTDMDYLNLLRLLAQYPDVTLSAYKQLEPNAVLSYIFSVAEQLNSCLDDDEEEEDVKDLTLAKVGIFEATRIVLENGMKLVGMKLSA